MTRWAPAIFHFLEGARGSKPWAKIGRIHLCCSHEFGFRIGVESKKVRGGQKFFAFSVPENEASIVAARGEFLVRNHVTSLGA
jgi:hypothetical protein